jgi:peptidoglycan/xylan/chitin deacetylase (PgdA/CDA1 family)
MLFLAGNNLTTILYHRFFFDEEPAECSRDRLKRQCEWICNNFSPLSLDSATHALETGELPRRSLLITIDDAKIEILRIADIFAAFNLPISVFACVGWCATESPDEDTLLVRLVNQIEWYSGPVKSMVTSRGRIVLGGSALETGKAIDLILADKGALQPEFESILAVVQDDDSARDQRVSCSWTELADLRASGVAIGGHSASHVNLATASPLRMRFEISETRRILDPRFGRCSVFAYPYGMSGTFSRATTEQLSQHGFRYAFLTHSDFADENTDLLHLPRISMPDRPMSHPEFCVRAAGAGVLYRKLKQSRFMPQRVRSRNLADDAAGPRDRLREC